MRDAGQSGAGPYMPMKPSARLIAFDALTAFRQRDAFIDLYLDAAFRRADLDEADRRLASAISLGVMRFRRRLDWWIDRYSKIPTTKLEPAVLDALRIGLFQLAYMDRIPDRAAVDETVKLVPRRATGFVNAVMRNLARVKNSLPTPTSPDEVESVGIRHSMPDWIVELWTGAYGKDAADRICQVMLSEAPGVLRAAGIERDELIARLADDGVDADATRFSREGVRVRQIEKAISSKAFADGLCYVQGEASQLVAELAGVKGGQRVLDACAAPGGKAMALAQAAGASGFVTALDVHEGRLGLVKQNAERLGLVNIKCVCADASHSFEVPGGPFDRILVDAPCSGLGELAKNPEAKWRLKAKDISRLARLQSAILENASAHLKKGGRLIYSVCTLSPSENRGVADAFCEKHPEFERLDVKEILGSGLQAAVCDGDFQFMPTMREPEGFYAAVFARKS